MRLGVICEPRDLPKRTERLLAALRGLDLDAAVPEDRGLDPILKVHDAAYLEFLQTAFERWRQLPGAGPEVLPNMSPYWNGRPDRHGRAACRTNSVAGQAGYYLGDLAVPIGPNTWTSAYASAQTAVNATDAVLSGEQIAYALCRPSGHHAQVDRASGFCYLNNSAIAAERLRTGHDRVVVLDVDVHHGDGTQGIFYRRGDVMTVSLHGDPSGYYPFHTGYADENGDGDGDGANCNIPLVPGTGDAAYLDALDGALDAIRRFKPGAMVVALGFDTHREDPLATLALSSEVFADIAARIRRLGCPLVVVQEGGYAIELIGDCLTNFLRGLSE